MLELRPGCELCDADLPGDSADAFICSFECTFCRACALRQQYVCPNCAGELQPRPRRSLQKLAANPASRQRIYRPRPGCIAKS